MFGFDQRARLLRESWTADNLAQELYAMFGDQVPNNTQAPVTITQPVASMQAPIQIQNYQDGNPIFNFGNKGSISLVNGAWQFTDPQGNTTPMC